MNGTSPSRSSESAPLSVFARPQGEPGPHVVRQPYVQAVCLWCSEGLPLVAIDEGQPPRFHAAGGGTFHSCALVREVAR